MKSSIVPKQSIHTGDLILVNREYKYYESEEQALVPVFDQTPQILMERRAATCLSALMESICGWQGIVPVSGWRSMQEQKEIYDDSIVQSGLDFTQKYVAYPGHSEHQTGLAIDLGLKQEKIDFIRPDFPYTGLCGTFREKAADYGFIERYPAGKEKITGIGHEPWHFRYVGTPHAAIITEMRLTLEEYIDFIRQYPYGQKSFVFQSNGAKIFISFLKIEPAKDALPEILNSKTCLVSGNNADGFIITEWEKRS